METEVGRAIAQCRTPPMSKRFWKDCAHYQGVMRDRYYGEHCILQQLINAVA